MAVLLRFQGLVLLSQFLLLLLLQMHAGSAHARVDLSGSDLGMIDETFLPEGVSQEEATIFVEAAWTQLLSNFTTNHNWNPFRKDELPIPRGRSSSGLSTTSDDCNTVLATYRAEDFRADLIEMVQAEAGFAGWTLVGWQLLLLEMVLAGRIREDIRLWKICGRCSDFGPGDVACREQDYGYNALHSGLLIAPFNAGEDRLLEQTLPVNVMAPAAGVVPSEAWTSPVTDPQVLIASFVTASSRSYTLMVDYIGFGESDEYYRGFLNYQSVVTSTIPLIWQAEAIVDQESNCTAAMADAYTTFGYSEGGYACVAIADALDRMGKQIISVHAGGGPYRVSTTVLVDAVEKLMHGDFDMNFFMTLLGAGFSTTNTDARNYGAGQDFFAPEYRDALIREAQLARVDRGGIYSVIPRDDPFVVYNQDLVRVIYEGGVLRGEPEPCITSVTNTTDIICQAMMDQDLVGILEAAHYPVFLFQSTTDEIVNPANLPDLSKNPNLKLTTVEGRHSPSAVNFAIQTILYFANPINVRMYPTMKKTTQGGCLAKQNNRCKWILGIFGLC